jgi:antitoxin component YwqK of YwqJK toxin-antitoxin module
MKYFFAILILFIAIQCNKQRHSEDERELVVNYVGYKKYLSEKYYKLKGKKNWLGEDVLDGIRIVYYRSGRINGIENWTDGYLDGWSMSYDETGKKIVEQLWEANFRSGTTETIKIINYGYYDDGKLATIYICDKSGNVVSETAYDKNGKVIP